MNQEMLRKKPLATYASFSVLALASVLSGGCANMPLDLSSRQDRIGIDDGRDPCRSSVVALDSTGNFFAGDMLKDALVGAAGGALVGGVAATASGKNPLAGAMVGAVVGGVAGAGFSYWNHLAQQGKDQAILTVNKDLDENISSAEKAQVALDGLLKCRKQQRDTIRTNYKKGLLKKEEAQAQWNEWGIAVKRDLALAETVSSNLGTRLDSFKYATEQANTPMDISKMTPQEKEEYDAKLKATMATMAAHEANERKQAKEEQAAKRKALTNEFKAKEAAAKKSGDKTQAAQLANAKKAALADVESKSKADQEMLKAKYSDAKEAAKKNPQGSLLLTKKHALTKKEGEVKAQVKELDVMAKQADAGFEDASARLFFPLLSQATFAPTGYIGHWLNAPSYPVETRALSS